MKFRFVMMLAAVFAAGPALAQTPAQAGPPVHQQPGVTSPAPTQPAMAPQEPAQPPQKVDPAKEKAIRHLMDITGTSKLGDNMTEVVAMQVKNAMSRKLPPDRLQKFMDDFNQKLSAKGPANEVADAQVPIYAQHFSMQELQGMITFYESPVGQLMVKSLPEVLQESQRNGAEIERTAALETLKDMSGDYPELKSMLPPDEQKPPSLGTPQPKPQTPAQPPKPQSKPQQ
jgi:uncharacterized protein